jgi:phosphoglycerol geranylgeranyltransferase
VKIGATEKELHGKAKERVSIAALIDPDDFTSSSAKKTAKGVQDAGASLVLIGGSTVADQNHLDDIVISVKKSITIPVILFPGNITGISRHADAILFSSLLNSSNNYFITGAQAIGAVQVKRYGLEAIPMAYLVFGENSSAGFIGEVRAIPYDKPSIAIMYALAAQYMGMRALYLEAGSGSREALPSEIVRGVRKAFDGLLVVGGGITDAKRAVTLAQAGADILVVGNLLQSQHGIAKLKKIIRSIRTL